MEAFGARFPDLFFRETKLCRVPEAAGGLHAGNYAFVEFYYSNPFWDCRCVLLRVWEESATTILACIRYGWASETAEIRSRLSGPGSGGLAAGS